MKLILKTIITVFAAALFTSCGSSSKPEPAPPVVKPVPVKVTKPKVTSTAALAKKILNHPKITLLRIQVSGRNDGASAYHSIASTSRGYSAKRSSYGHAPGGYVKLDRKMLEFMLYLADVKGYRYRVTSIVGGSHSRNSRHYAGKGVDIDMINGVKVGYGKAHYRTVMSIARSKGATEVLGPGTKGHSRHIHLAWPR